MVLARVVSRKICVGDRTDPFLQHLDMSTWVIVVETGHCAAAWVLRQRTRKASCLVESEVSSSPQLICTRARAPPFQLLSVHVTFDRVRLDYRAGQLRLGTRPRCVELREDWFSHHMQRLGISTKSVVRPSLFCLNRPPSFSPIALSFHLRPMSTEPASKKMKSSKVIGTHSGSFHADEALAVFLLRQTKEYRDAEVVRTRDPAKLDELDIVVDVGGVYDAEKQRYDHHQRGFTEVFGTGSVDVKEPPAEAVEGKKNAWFSTKLSSAGLVYKHFGREVIANVCGVPESDERVQTLWIKLYKEFIEGIDGIDNGVEQYPGAKPVYSSRTGLSARVGWLNPRWNEESDDTILDVSYPRRPLDHPLTLSCSLASPRRRNWRVPNSWTGSTTISTPGCQPAASSSQR